MKNSSKTDEKKKLYLLKLQQYEKKLMNKLKTKK